jgi:hypothetical protein
MQPGTRVTGSCDKSLYVLGPSVASVAFADRRGPDPQTFRSIQFSRLIPTPVEVTIQLCSARKYHRLLLNTLLTRIMVLRQQLEDSRVLETQRLTRRMAFETIPDTCRVYYP